MMALPEAKFTLRVPDAVASVLKKLHPVIKSHIRTGLKIVISDPYIGKALKDELSGIRSYRIKKYRIIYRVINEKQLIDIIAVGPRKTIYEETFRIISKS